MSHFTQVVNNTQVVNKFKSDWEKEEKEKWTNLDASGDGFQPVHDLFPVVRRVADDLHRLSHMVKQGQTFFLAFPAHYVRIGYDFGDGMRHNVNEDNVRRRDAQDHPAV